jgi:peroxiredoxin
MRLSRLALFSVTLAFAPLAAIAAAAIDQAAPNFTANTADGKTLELSSLRGKTVVLEWTNHDCPFVKKHYESGNIPRLQQAAKAKDIVWLQVISSAPGKQGYVDGATAIKLNASRHATPTNTLLDPEGKLGQLYGAQTTPHIYIIDAKGTLVYKGGIDSIASADKADITKAEPYVEQALGALADGKKIANASTKPYGCSVKY